MFSASAFRCWRTCVYIAGVFFLGGTMKKYYFVYEVEAQNEKQVQAIALDLFNRTGVEPKLIFAQIDWDINNLTA